MNVTKWRQQLNREKRQGETHKKMVEGTEASLSAHWSTEQFMNLLHNTFQQQEQKASGFVVKMVEMVSAAIERVQGLAFENVEEA
ncbi:hypothetical protein scyTo_0004343 [Scyliorhinus torazame]|uniref:Uncharacterized protein n=1 Tax=Scyliorhinus torazame TaxID=75743 RepID=A0A401NQE5_SCYTO|nr:hypothetical protein [Scyliorhinus torazame]